MANRKRTRSKEHRMMGSTKRRKFAGTSFKGSYKYDDSYSSSDESGQEDNRREKSLPEVKSVSTEKHLTCSLQLSDQDLWSISSQMNAIKWRALGRTLGLEEDILLNLEHAHKGSGVRECAYQMLLEWKGMKPKSCTFGNLYISLSTEKMNGVAKHMAALMNKGNLVQS